MTVPIPPQPPDQHPEAVFHMPGPVHVPSLSPDEREQVLDDLRIWVAALVTRLHIDTRVIPPCWDRHNGMVEALQALRDLERDCYSCKAPPSAAVDWFRGFREIEARLIEFSAMTTCSAREHRDPRPRWPALQADS